MTSHAQVSRLQSNSADESPSQLFGWIKTVGQGIARCASTCADYYAAAALYDRLRGLSDAELRHRGLARGTLARDICGACDRAGSR